MKNILMTAFIAILMIANATAGGRFSVGGELGSPMGSYADAVHMGYGGSLRYELPVGYSIDVTATASYLLFPKKDSNDGTNVTQIPIQLGAKAYFKEDQNGWYGHVMMGMNISSSDAEGAESRNNFTWSPELGYMFSNFDIGLRYQIVTSQALINGKWAGLRLAYVFGSRSSAK